MPVKQNSLGQRRPEQTANFEFANGIPSFDEVVQLDRARELGKTLATLDTRTGDVAEPLYTSVGFEVAGVIPIYACQGKGSPREPIGQRPTLPRAA